MLEILAVLRNQSRRELEEFGSQLWNKLRSDEVLDWLLLFGIRVDVNVELYHVIRGLERFRPEGRLGRQLTTNSSSSVSWATSGTVMVPETSSSSAVDPT